MNDRIKLVDLVESPSARRLWLLVNALRSLPLDRAIELARSAEAFVTGAPPRTPTDSTHLNPGPSPIQTLESLSAADSGSTTAADPEGTNAAPIPSSAPQRIEQTAHKRSPIQGADRDRLLARLAAGARKAELAAEFGISSKQVQGIRMGCAREIARRRDQLSGNTVPAGQTAVSIASIQEVVRYLRQQDDVVVAQENRGFLVNGRLQMRLAELVSRANRMRARQGKPAFELQGSTPVPRDNISSANGHPLFWEKPAPTERVRNGLQQRGRSSPEGA